MCMYVSLDPTLSVINDQSITVLRGSVVTFECTPSDTSFVVRWIFYSPDGTVIRIPLNFRDDGEESASRFPTTVGPAGLFYQLTVFDVPLTATGIFSCEVSPPCRDNIVIAQNTSLTVQPG